MTSPDGERAHLEAIVYGRPGITSEAELAEARTRLAELDREQHPAAQVVETPTESPPAQESRRPSRKAMALVVGALVILAAVAVLLAPRTTSSLAVFDRPQTADDLRYPNLGLEQEPGSERLLLTDGDMTLVAFRNADAGVCLGVFERANLRKIECAHDEQFGANGIASGPLPGSADAEGYRPSVEFLWGPTGGPRRIDSITPPAPPPLEIFDRPQTETDLSGIEQLSELDEKERATLRWLGKYNSFRLFVFRPDDATVCLAAIDRSIMFGESTRTCTTDDDFEQNGLTLDTREDPTAEDALRVTWGPTPGFRVTTVPLAEQPDP